MNITIDKTVKYNVSKIEVFNIIIDKIGTDLIFIIPFEWKSPSGEVINKGLKRYTESDLTTLASNLGISFSPLIDIFKTILGQNGVGIRINLLNSPEITAVVIAKVSGKYSQTNLDKIAFETAINPFTNQNLIQIIEIIGSELTS